MKVCLLGSTGFIGNAIAEQLLLQDIPFFTINRSDWDMEKNPNDLWKYQPLTHIINAAGCTDFYNIERNWSTNYNAPLNIFHAYNVPIFHFGTSWTKYVNEIDTPYLQAKMSLELQLPKFPNVTILKPSIVTGHSAYGYLPGDKFFGFGQWLAKSHEYDDMWDKKWDLVPADWCAKIVVEMIKRDKLMFKEYNLTAGQDSETLGELFQVYDDVEIIGQLNPTELTKVKKIAKMYRQYVEMEALFNNDNLFFDDFPMPSSVVDINRSWVNRLEPKTIMWSM